MMRDPQHPGTVVYLDGDTGQVVSRLPADEVPRESRFAPGEDGELVPIVKVVAHLTSGGREILEYGPGDRLLRVTAQRADPPVS
jgi:hypothetical protein